MKTRRDFLKLSGLASAALAYPQLFNFQLGGDYSGKRLVIIQLSGGNDGLNCFVPYRNDIYYSKRPGISIKPDQALRLTDEYGLNPSLRAFQELYDKGELTILNGVGYPEPNRSHFRSMDIWQSASASNEYLSSGWLGRWSSHKEASIPAIGVNGNLNLALKAEKSKAMAISSIKGLKRTADDKIIQAVRKMDHDHSNDMASYLYQTTRRLSEGAEYLMEKTQTAAKGSGYPANPLAKDLSMIAQLIKAGSETQVYYASLSGFDTHVNQKGTHSRLLESLSGSVKAFKADLKQDGKWNDTLIMVFSEFGRRVEQNAGGGTDHGAASNVWLMGGNLKEPGIRNELPSLSDLDKGDLKYSIDFRDVYAGILENWLKSDHQSILNGRFNPITV